MMLVATVITSCCCCCLHAHQAHRLTSRRRRRAPKTPPQIFDWLRGLDESHDLYGLCNTMTFTTAISQVGRGLSTFKFNFGPQASPPTGGRPPAAVAAPTAAAAPTGVPCCPSSLATLLRWLARPCQGRKPV